MARIGRSFPTHPHRARVPRTIPTATITAVAALAGAGVKNAAGSATITAAAALAGAGLKTGVGAATVTGAADLTGSGDKASGIGSIPRPRLRWQLVVGPASGGHELALTEAKGRRMVFKLTDPHEVSFQLDGRHAQAAAIDELAVDVHVLWTSPAGATRILSRGRAGTSGDTLDDRSHTLDATALDYRAVLNRRRLYSDSTLTWAATDQALLAWELVEQTQGRAGGDLGISRGIGQTTGINRDRIYEAGDSIGERVQELSELIDGFDWEITPASASALHLDIWYPQRGTDRGVVLEYGGLVAKARREVNSSDYGNALRYTGTAGDDVTPGPTPAELEAADIGTVAQGRWDLVFGDDGLTTQAALDERAAWQILQSQVIRPVYTLTLRPGGWEGPDFLWLGDPVRVVIRSGRLDVDTVLRVYEIAVSLGDSGEETVEVTAGGPKPSYKRRPSLIDRRLTNLERR